MEIVECDNKTDLRDTAYVDGRGVVGFSRVKWRKFDVDVEFLGSNNTK